MRESEIWKWIPGFKGMYKISSHGRIKSYSSKKQGDFRNPRLDESGYLFLGLYREGKCRTARVHRLVLETFVGPCPPGKQGCHRNDIKTDNYLGNLRWGTQRSNAKDSIRNGRQVRGESVTLSKLKEEQIVRIRKLYKKGWRQIPLGRKFKVSQRTISVIVRGETWTHI